MAEKDRVQVPSRRKDGTPDQTEDYELIGDPETTKAAIAEQLGQMAVSEADQARAAEQAAVDGPTLTPEEKAREDEHKKLMDDAAKQAEAEVSAHGQSTSEPESATAKRSANVETAATRTSKSGS